MIPYNECIVFLLAKGNQKAQKNLKNQLKPYGLTPVQALILGSLYEENGLTASEIGKRLVLDNATVSGVLDRLSESNWVARKTDKQDKRVQRIYLSAHSDADIVKKLFDARKKANEETMSRFSLEEKILLKRLLRDLT